MFGSSIKAELRHSQQLAASQSRILDAIRQNLAWIEFTRDGEILDANQAFLNVVGYSLDEVRGQHQARRALEIAAAGGHNLLALCVWRPIVCAESQNRV